MKNEKGFTIFQIVALVFIVLILFTAIFTVRMLFNKEEVIYFEAKETANPQIILNGSYVQFVEKGKKYKEENAVAINKDNENISDRINIRYYKDDRVVTEIDTTKKNVYKIVYSVTDSKTTLFSAVSRTVIII